MASSYISSERKLEEKNIISCLEHTLKEHGISKYYYNLYGYSEDKICLEKLAYNEWLIFYGCHGERTNKKVYPNVKEASRNIIRQLSDDEIVAKHMIYEFNCELKRYGIVLSAIPTHAGFAVVTGVSAVPLAPTVTLGRAVAGIKTVTGTQETIPSGNPIAMKTLS